MVVQVAAERRPSQRRPSSPPPAALLQPGPETIRRSGVYAQSCPDGNCGEGEGGAYPYVFALGRIEARPSSLAVEKEFAQATGLAPTVGLTDAQAMFNVLSEPANRYLAKQMSWIFTVEGLETYLLTPREASEVDMLIEAARPAGEGDLDVVVGIRGPLAPPEMANGLQVPMVAPTRVWSFQRNELIQAIPRPAGVAERDEERFRTSASEMFDRMIRVADNAGATDEDRARNFLAVRYQEVYARAAQAVSENRSLTSIDARPSPVSGIRRVMRVVFTFTDRQTNVPEQSSADVDVTEVFPFLVSPLRPFFEH